jgi:hypothetical protein
LGWGWGTGGSSLQQLPDTQSQTHYLSMYDNQKAVLGKIKQASLFSNVDLIIININIIIPLFSKEVFCQVLMACYAINK